MNTLKLFFVLFLLAIGLMFESETDCSAARAYESDQTKYKKQNSHIELDQYDRIVSSQENGKANYLLEKVEIDTLKKGNEKGNSIPFSGIPNKDTLISTHDITQDKLSEGISSSLLNEDWRMGIFGSGIGKSGIMANDIDNDGVTEIIAGGSTSTFGSDNFWYILEYSSLKNKYNMVWVSNIYSSGISNIAVFDTDNNGVFEVFVGLADGDIAVYDGANLEKVYTINSSASSVNRILFADGDNDSIKEIIFCDDNNMYFYDPVSFSLEHQLAYGADDCEIGNVDGDISNEIVLANGLVLEYNGVTATIEWDYPGGDFGYLIELSDIDSDNMQEIIGASDWYYITSFDADIQSPKWQIPTDLDVDALLLVDVDNDGVEDLLYGDGQWGAIYCHDALSTTLKWQINNPEHGVTDIAVVDSDGDGHLEVLWGAGASSTGEDHLYVHQINTLAFEWQSTHLDGPFHAVDVGDIDGDGTQEIVIASFESNSRYDDGIIRIYDAVTHELEWQSAEDMFGGYAWTGIHDLKIGDPDGDGDKEIVVATDKLYDGAIYVINGSTHVIEQSYFYDDGAPIYSVAIADVDNDGQTEIVAGGGRAHTGAPGVYVYVIDGSTGAVEWHSISIGDYWSEVSAVEVGDIDNDGTPDIVAVNDNIFIFDGVSHQQWQSTIGRCYGLDLYDTDNDGVEEIVVGTESGNIVAVDGQTLVEEFNADVSSSSIVGLHGSDINQDGNPEIIFSSSGSLWVYSISTSSLLWQSKILSSSTGEYNSIVVSDIDSDDHMEVLTGTDHTIVEFVYTDPQIPPAEKSGFLPAIFLLRP
jgi:FG-GAP-like repeat